MPAKPLTPAYLKRRISLQTAQIWRKMSASRRALPGFIVIGAQKAGTTSLFKTLRQHPAIVPASKKEIKFFDCNFGLGLNWYRAHFPYQTEMKAGCLTGEASPHYIAHPLTPQRIAQTLPGIKLVALLRNPVERAYSHYQLNVRRGREPLSFEEAIEQEPERLRKVLQVITLDESYPLYNFLHYSYLKKGLYAEQLERWYEVFPASQILVLQSEDFFANPERSFARVVEFLGLPAWAPEKFKAYNMGSYTAISPDLRQRLQAYFEPHNQRLFELLRKHDATQAFDWKGLN
jgi:hypothetical protein